MRKGDAFKSEVRPYKEKGGLQKCGAANGNSGGNSNSTPSAKAYFLLQLLTGD
jgi:hypothetical protein